MTTVAMRSIWKWSLAVKCGVCLLLLFVLFNYNWWQSGWTEIEYKNKYLASIPSDLANKPVTSEDSCSCNRSQQRTFVPSTSGEESTCDYYATVRGPQQWVISFSLYGSILSENDYFNGVQANLQRIAEIYPEWVVRVYHSVDTADQNLLDALCKLWCQFSFLDFCQVGRLPSPIGDESQINGMIWRFFPLGDPLVDRFLIRDLDSVVSNREAAAVAEWLSSNYTWHFMHDHPYHTVPILGGMWGGINRDLQLTSNLRTQLIESGLKYSKGTDQELLAKYLKPIAEEYDDYLNHNSYLCGIYWKRSVPFPTRRTSDMDYVGYNNELRLPLTQHCPENCRPQDHPDWNYC